MTITQNLITESSDMYLLAKKIWQSEEFNTVQKCIVSGTVLTTSFVTVLLMALFVTVGFMLSVLATSLVFPLGVVTVLVAGEQKVRTIMGLYPMMLDATLEAFNLR